MTKNVVFKGGPFDGQEHEIEVGNDSQFITACLVGKNEGEMRAVLPTDHHDFVAVYTIEGDLISLKNHIILRGGPLDGIAIDIELGDNKFIALGVSEKEGYAKPTDQRDEDVKYLVIHNADGSFDCRRERPTA